MSSSSIIGPVGAEPVLPAGVKYKRRPDRYVVAVNGLSHELKVIDYHHQTNVARDAAIAWYHDAEAQYLVMQGGPGKS